MKPKHIIKKQYGQNFLNDVNLLTYIVEKADLDNQNVVEIGPGKGALTKLIVTKAKKVVAYEIDTSLKPFLQFDSHFDINIIYYDFLKRNLEQDFQTYFQEEDIVLIGNLPYNITSPILFKILFLPQIKNFTIMVQKEVALRLLSKPHNTTYNSISVIFQSLMVISQIKDVKNTMFFPKPKVDSIVLKFERILLESTKKAFIEKKFFTFVKASFQQKRKKLLNNLHSYFKISKKELMPFFDKNQLSLDIRAEQIGIAQFQQIATSFFDFFVL
ncbi:16S rRNA (adenine(1518)-N(6)/adenine(1519)-N(6))-dimethyltransferase RsmA [Italian clover phyllody phytoplasma]|uniref:16S rRNA (adenine(1518)-N(6)/adenine(1519)-N(6))- dimethyltransferase RsmA n=1 Tax=Italian clover phyllody phytoplasma TaxID=1196420 RepID=UPI00031F616B|nr:16S rRNA (adenine(1518)-N(6)/adenine(1519)-N(6))-dimethyltransferase RsmA [Italian clover phyllody phytoplasma]